MDKEAWKISEAKIKIPLNLLASSLIRTKDQKSLQDLVQTEYAARYCESIGVSASAETVQLIHTNLPINEALVAPNWTTQSLDIIPGRGKETQLQRHLRSVRDAEDEQIKAAVLHHTNRANIPALDKIGKQVKVPHRKKISPMIPFDDLGTNKYIVSKIIHHLT